MRIESPSFKNGESIPSKFTCDGDNTSPELRIFDVPEKAQSLVLIMDDPDIPEIAKTTYGITEWEHWLVFNIPANTSSISEGQNPEGIVAKNTRGNNAYGSPCPPDREHRYFFKLYALDSMLDIPQNSNKTDIEKAMYGHIIEKAELMGKYKRN